MDKQQTYSVFVKWFAMPKETRYPATEEEFCTLAKISKQDLAEFANRDTFYDDLVKEAKNWGKTKLPEMLHMLYNDFKENKKPVVAQTFKSLLELDKEQKPLNINVFNLPEQQYRQIVAREAKLLETSSAEQAVELLSDN